MNTNKPQLEWDHVTDEDSCASYATLYSLSVHWENSAWIWYVSRQSNSEDVRSGTKPTKLEAMIASEQYVAKKLLELPKLEIRED